MASKAPCNRDINIELIAPIEWRLPSSLLLVYNPPIKEEIKELVPLKEETILYNVDPVVPTAYIEKPPFPVRIKEHAKVATVVNRSCQNTKTRITN